jgi:hypothetical protein
MGAILYYAPRREAITLEQMAELGIDTQGVVSPKTRHVTNGPDGGAGLVFVLQYDGHKQQETTAGYYPDRQTWEQAPGRDYWNGYYNTEKPAPGDLVRSGFRGGYPVTLLDGNDWYIPIGKYAAPRKSDTPLPRRTRFNGVTHEPGDVLPEYQWIFDTGARVLEILNGEREDDWTFAEQATLCCRLLGVNYHVGPCEIELLRLISESEQGAILRMAGDAPGWWDIKKKEAAATGSLSAGGAEY